MYRGFSSPEKPATGSQRGVEKDGARERPGKEVHRKPENTRLPLASPETGLSQEPPETLADDGIDLLWGAEGGQSRSGPRTEHCGPRSDQPPVNRNPVQEVRRRSLIVRYPGGFSAVTSRPPASHAIRTSVGSALPARVASAAWTPIPLLIRCHAGYGLMPARRFRSMSWKPPMLHWT